MQTLRVGSRVYLRRDFGVAGEGECLLVAVDLVRPLALEGAASDL